MSDRWLYLKEAAAMLGYNPEYFRQTFCQREAPRLVLRVTGGPKRRRIEVSESSILKYLAEHIQIPKRA